MREELKGWKNAWIILLFIPLMFAALILKALGYL